MGQKPVSSVTRASLTNDSKRVKMAGQAKNNTSPFSRKKPTGMGKEMDKLMQQTDFLIRKTSPVNQLRAKSLKGLKQVFKLKDSAFPVDAKNISRMRKQTKLVNKAGLARIMGKNILPTSKNTLPAITSKPKAPKRSATMRSKMQAKARANKVATRISKAKEFKNSVARFRRKK